MMESSDMKNMVVLKNLPSNMVEEAIIIFKESQKVKQKELIDKSKNMNSIQIESKSKDYILKEAEMLVTDYINKIEDKKNTLSNKNIKERYENLKIYSITSTILLAISLIINFI
jgi:hypothetical protein